MWRDLWSLDPTIRFLNHGSFGACPVAVLEKQARIRTQIEAEPVRFFSRELEPALDGVRLRLARFLVADPADLVFVRNATMGVNAVLRSLSIPAGAELLTTDHEYNACRNVLDYVAERAGATVVVAEVPFPLRSPEEVVERVLRAASPRTFLALIDHVTSPTGLVLPVEEIVRGLGARGVKTLIDGAHAPGMLDLRLDELGADYYTGNCHKWLCTPKGAAFLHVRRSEQPFIRPTSISHGANSLRTDKSRFLLEFDWTGTDDPSAILCIPESIDAMSQLLPGGMAELRQHNRALALAGRKIVCDAVGASAPCPDSMIGSLAAVPLPDGRTSEMSPLYGDPLQDALLDRFQIEVPVVPWPGPPKRLVRIAAQIYNTETEYSELASALKDLLAEGL